LRRCTVHDLEAVYGVGPKTARFFLTHSRPDQNFAVLDTHILRWMRVNVDAYAPRATPSGKRYAEVEQDFLAYCAERNVSPAELDLQIWSEGSRKAA